MRAASRLDSRPGGTLMRTVAIDLDGCEGAVIINSWLTDDPQRSVLPVDRQQRYAGLLESYQTFPVNPRDVDELCRLEEARFALARDVFLNETWDHFFVLFSSTDWLGHGLTGAFLGGDADARAAFLRFYRQLDGYIGWFLEQAGDALVAVLSDHGQCEELAVVRINDVLHRLGLARALDR